MPIFNHDAQVKIEEIFTIPVIVSDSKQAMIGARTAIHDFFYTSKAQAKYDAPTVEHFNKFKVTIIVEQVE